jgi:hypothetical protein
MRPSIVLACAVLAGAAFPAAAQTLKPGLWEMRQKMGGNPEMDKAMAEMQQQMAAMSPEQRKQMESMMASRGVQVAPGAGGAMVMKMCMTKEMVERDEVPATQGDCKTTRQQRSGNTMSVAFTCTNPPSSGDSKITFNGPESYSSKTSVTTTQKGGRPEKMTMEGTGKWLGANCGAIKPVQGR